MGSLFNKLIPSSRYNFININKFWLAGFIDAEGTFSTNKYVPRFKLENHIKELELHHKIFEFIGAGNILLGPARANSNPTVIYEVNKVNELLKIFIPLMYDNGSILLKTLKLEDLKLWLKLVDLYYKGYHTILKGKYVFDAIKLHMNKYRMTTNINLVKDKNYLSISEINNLLNELYLLESPYEIKNGLRHYRNTDKLVSESTKILVILKENNNQIIYESMSECSLNLGISRKKIKECLTTGKEYKGYIFIYN